MPHEYAHRECKRPLTEPAADPPEVRGSRIACMASTALSTECWLCEATMSSAPSALARPSTSPTHLATPPAM